MPNSGDWVNIGTSSTGDTFTWSFSGTAQQMYEEWRQECIRQDQIYEQQMQMMEQQMEEERQLIEDKRKYPLFFWRELCSKQRKENI